MEHLQTGCSTNQQNAAGMIISLAFAMATGDGSSGIKAQRSAQRGLVGGGVGVCVCGGVVEQAT